MFTFTSVHPAFRIFGKPVQIGKEMIPEFDAKFIRHGAVGHFVTEDEQLAEKLRKHPNFGKAFTEMSIPKNLETNVVSGIRSSATQPELGKTEIDKSKLIRFGVLQNKLLKQDGTYRIAVPKEEIAEYELLKKELE